MALGKHWTHQSPKLIGQHPVQVANKVPTAVSL